MGDGGDVGQLAIVREPLVEPAGSQRSPLHCQAAKLVFFTETDVAASLICQDLGIASSIRIEVMAVQDTEVGVRVTGKNTAIKPIALPKAKAKGKAKAKAAATTNFDFMELLLTPAAPPGAQAATARPSAGLTAATPSPIVRVAAACIC